MILAFPVFAIAQIKPITNTKIDKSSALKGKRWHCDSYKKNGLTVNLKATDFFAFNADGSFEQVMLNIYSKGTWTFDNANSKITVTNGGAFIWTITDITDSTLKFNNGVEFYEFKKMKAFGTNASASAKTKELAANRWKIKEHKKAGITINYKANDFIAFYADGTYEQVLLGIYSKATWSFGAGETIINVVNGGTFPWTVVTWAPASTGVQVKNSSETLWLIK